MTQETCYHCGLPIPTGLSLSTTVGGVARDMCCFGCQAVAQAIVDNGLEDYYLRRAALPSSQRDALPEALDELGLYDHAEFQKSFVRALGEHEREASLVLEGIVCAACIWLNERHVAALPGVTGIEINFTTRRARVRWDETRIRLSDILAAIAAIGYRAHPYDAQRSEALARKERRSALWRVFVAGFGMMQVMMYAVPAYLAGDGEMSDDIAALMRWASLVLTLPVVGYSAAPFFRGALRDLRLRRVGMDVPVALGIGAAFVASVWATLVGGGEVYFDSVTMFVFFLLGGRYLEMAARQQAAGATEALARLRPVFAWRVAGYPDARALERVAASELAAGDVVLVRPGEAVPADACVLEGTSSADESLLTGESRPVGKMPGAALTGGSVNGEGALYARVEKVGEATRLSTIIRLMERAAGEKPRIVETADRIASRFLEFLLLLAAGVALAWFFADRSQALWVTVSVLVVTCPCALSLATPVALTVASGVLARHGLLVTRGHAIETLARATHVVFDKTGTLTTGDMRLLDVRTLGAAGREACVALAAAIEHASEHPLARALRAAAAGLPLPAAAALHHVAGGGVEAQVEGRRCRVGRPDFVRELHGQPLPEAAAELIDGEATVVALGDETGWLALFCLGDALRPEAESAVAGLRAAGKTVLLLTGDTWGAARRVAAALQIEGVEAAVPPQGKYDYVAALQAGGAVVAMVGDGINDAPVLARAQVSIAMGGGTQLARTQADLVLLSNNLDALASGCRVATRCVRIIRENFLWAFAYNALALPLAIAGWVTPWMAGIGMSGSSLLVVLNSLRVRRSQPK